MQEENQNRFRVEKILIGPLITLFVGKGLSPENALLPGGGKRSGGGGKDQVCEDCEEGGSGGRGRGGGPVGSRVGVHTIDHVLTRRRTGVRAQLRLAVELVDAWERLQLGKGGRK